MKLFLALAAATTLMAPAVAWPAAPTVRVVVSTAGLDLATTAGQARLDRRIARAAEAACGEASTFDIVGLRHIRDCKTGAILAVAPQRAAAFSQTPLAVASAAR